MVGLLRNQVQVFLCFCFAMDNSMDCFGRLSGIENIQIAVSDFLGFPHNTQYKVGVLYLFHI